MSIILGLDFVFGMEIGMHVIDLLMWVLLDSHNR